MPTKKTYNTLTIPLLLDTITATYGTSIIDTRTSATYSICTSDNTCTKTLKSHQTKLLKKHIVDLLCDLESGKEYMKWTRCVCVQETTEATKATKATKATETKETSYLSYLGAAEFSIIVQHLTSVERHRLLKSMDGDAETLRAIRTGISFHTNPVALAKEFMYTVQDVPINSQDEVKLRIRQLLMDCRKNISVTIGIIYVNTDGTFTFQDTQKHFKHKKDDKNDMIYYIKMSIHDPIFVNKTPVRLIKYMNLWNHTVYMKIYNGANLRICTNRSVDIQWNREEKIANLLSCIC